MSVKRYKLTETVGYENEFHDCGLRIPAGQVMIRADDYAAETARADRAEADNAELLARLEASERVVTAYLEHQAHQPVTPLEDGVFPKWWETDLHLQRNLHEALRAYDAAAIRRGEQG